MNKKYKYATLVLGFTMFVTGFTGLVFEYILSTVATYILGNSVEQFSITIGIMLSMMGVGGWAQRYISEEKKIVYFVLIEIFLALIGGFAPIVMYASFGMMETHFVLVQYFLAITIGFLIGFEVPLAIRIAQEYTESLSSNLALIFSLDYVGAFAGAMLFSRVLMPSFPLTEMSFVLAAFNLLAGLAVLLYFSRIEKISFGFKKTLAYLFFILISGAGLTYGYMNNREWNVELEQRLYRDKIIFGTTTAYQRIVLTQNIAKGEHRLFLNGSLQFSSLDEIRYHEFLVHVPMLFADKREVKALILGGGDGLALRDILKYEQVKSVTLVDLDPGMLRFASTHPVMTRLNNNSFARAQLKTLKSGSVYPSSSQQLMVDGPRSLKAKRTPPPALYVADVRVLNIDADKFLSEIHEVFDIIIIDFPDPRSIELSKLYSKEFYLKLRRVLAQDGITAIQSTSVYYSKEPFLMIGRTLRSAGFKVVPYHHDVPAFGDWGFHLVKKDLDEAEIADRLKTVSTIPVVTEYVTPSLIANSLDFGKKMLESEFNDINTLMEPKLLHLYLKSWVTD